MEEYWDLPLNVGQQSQLVIEWILELKCIRKPKKLSPTSAPHGPHTGTWPPTAPNPGPKKFLKFLGKEIVSLVIEVGKRASSETGGKEEF